MTKRTDIEGIRAAVNRRLTKSDETASDIAAEAGISKGAMSEFRRGVYKGNNTHVAEKLAAVVIEKQTAADILDGKRELIYTVQYKKKDKVFIRNTKSLTTMQTWMEVLPEAVGFVGWWSKEAGRLPVLRRWDEEMIDATN